LTSQGRRLTKNSSRRAINVQENMNPNQNERAMTSHWKSTYQGNVEETLSRAPMRSMRPEWSLPRQAYSSQRTFFVTENMRSFGTYGMKPQDRIDPNAEKIENQHHELT